MRINQAVIARIQFYCKERKLSINGLAYLCGMPRSTINNLVSGRNAGTSVLNIQKICDGLGITISDFFDDDMFRHIEQEIR